LALLLALLAQGLSRPLFQSPPAVCLLCLLCFNHKLLLFFFFWLSAFLFQKESRVLTFFSFISMARQPFVCLGLLVVLAAALCTAPVAAYPSNAKIK